MACTLSNNGIATGCTIQASQVSQSVDAFTKAEAYDVTLSGSLVVTGSVAFSSSNAYNFTVQGITNVSQTNVLSYNDSTGTIGYVAASTFITTPAVSPYETGSACDIKPLKGGNKTNNCTFSNIGGGQKNNINSIFSVIGGGLNNCIGKTSDYSFVGGGIFNTASKESSTVVGGTKNYAYGENSTIVGGKCSIASSEKAFIGGGGCHLATGVHSTIAGGVANTSSADHSFIGGGERNRINDDSNGCSVIIGGCCNNIVTNGNYSAIAGGLENQICHCHSFIIGSCITTSAQCTTHVNNLNIGCTTQMQLRDPIGTGQAGMLTACNAGGGVAELYFHDGTSYKKVCLVP